MGVVTPRARGFERWHAVMVRSFPGHASFRWSLGLLGVLRGIPIGGVRSTLGVICDLDGVARHAVDVQVFVEQQRSHRRSEGGGGGFLGCGILVDA